MQALPNHPRPILAMDLDALYRVAHAVPMLQRGDLALEILKKAAAAKTSLMTVAQRLAREMGLDDRYSPDPLTVSGASTLASVAWAFEHFIAIAGAADEPRPMSERERRIADLDLKVRAIESSKSFMSRDDWAAVEKIKAEIADLHKEEAA